MSGDVHRIRFFAQKNAPRDAERFCKTVLLCAEEAVAGVAETGQDVTVVVEAAVEGGDEDLHIGVRFGDGLYADGTGAAMMLISMIFLQPRSLRKPMAAEALPPVASMGSSRMATLFSMPSGSLQ